jgi:transposase
MNNSLFSFEPHGVNRRVAYLPPVDAAEACSLSADMATDREIAEALQLYRKGEMFTKDIARKFGVSQSTITVWAKAAGESLRTRGRNRMNQPTLRQRKIMEMAAIHDYDTVGRHFGITKQAVHRIVKRWAPHNKPKRPPYVPGDTLVWHNKKLTVLAAEVEHGTVIDQKGKIFRCFTWATGGRLPRKTGHNADYRSLVKK